MTGAEGPVLSEPLADGCSRARTLAARPTVGGRRYGAGPRGGMVAARSTLAPGLRPERSDFGGLPARGSPSHLGRGAQVGGAHET